MTVGQLLASTSSRELAEWMAEDSLRQEEAKRDQLGAAAVAGVQARRARRRRR